MISPIHYIYITEFVSLCLRINDSGLFAWISLDCFVVDLFYFCIEHFDGLMSDIYELKIQTLFKSHVCNVNCHICFHQVHLASIFVKLPNNIFVMF